jgi:hypothetical protein
MYEIREGSGRHGILLRLWETEHGWIGGLTGGELSHVGGVVLANPRPSLSGSGTSCDIWAIPLPGHLDCDVAVPLVRRFCARIGVPITLTVGIHVDNATKEDLVAIRSNCEKAGEAFFEQVSRRS